MPPTHWLRGRVDPEPHMRSWPTTGPYRLQARLEGFSTTTTHTRWRHNNNTHPLASQQQHTPVRVTTTTHTRSRHNNNTHPLASQQQHTPVRVTISNLEHTHTHARVQATSLNKSSPSFYTVDGTGRLSSETLVTARLETRSRFPEPNRSPVGSASGYTAVSTH